MSTAQNTDSRPELQGRANFESRLGAMSSQTSSPVQDNTNLSSDQSKERPPQETTPVSTQTGREYHFQGDTRTAGGNGPSSLATILLENIVKIHDPDSREAPSRVSNVLPEEVVKPDQLDTVEAIKTRLEVLARVDEINVKRRSSLAEMWQESDQKLQQDRTAQDEHVRVAVDKALRTRRLAANETRLALRTRQEDAFDLANQRIEEETMELTRRMILIRRGGPTEDLPQNNRAASASYAPPIPQQDSWPPAKRHQSGPPSQNSPAAIPPPAYQFYQPTFSPAPAHNVLLSHQVPYSLFPRNGNTAHDTQTASTPSSVPPTTTSRFTPVNMTAPSGFATVNSRPVNGAASSPPPLNSTPTASTPTHMPTEERRAAPKSEAWEKRHHRCERFDDLGRGIWTAYGPGGTRDRPTTPAVEMYIRCTHDGCMRMDWQTVHSLLVHLVKVHEQPRGSVGGLPNALEKYGVPVSEIEAYEREHGRGSAGTFVEHKKTKAKTKRAVVPLRHPASLVSPPLPSPTVAEDWIRYTPPSSVGLSGAEGYATKDGYVQEEILYSSEDSDGDDKTRRPSTSKGPEPGTGEKRKQMHESPKAPASYIPPNGVAPLRFSTQPSGYQINNGPATPDSRNDKAAEPPPSLLSAPDVAVQAGRGAVIVASTETPEVMREVPRIEDKQSRVGAGFHSSAPSDVTQPATRQDSGPQTPSVLYETTEEVMKTAAAAPAAAAIAAAAIAAASGTTPVVQETQSREEGSSSLSQATSKSAQAHARGPDVGGQKQAPLGSARSPSAKGPSTPRDRAASLHQRSHETGRKPAEYVHGDHRDKSTTSRHQRSPEIAKQLPRKDDAMAESGATNDTPGRTMGHSAPPSDSSKRHFRKDSSSTVSGGTKKKDSARPSWPAGHTKAQSDLQDLQKVISIDDESADDEGNLMETHGSPPTRRSTNRSIKRPTKYEGAL